MTLGRPHHVGMVVSDLAEAKASLGAALGLDWGVDSYPDLVVRSGGAEHEVSLRTGVSRQGSPHVELLEPAQGGVWEAPGCHHLGYAVDDVAAAVRELESQGFHRLIEPVSPEGEELRWTYLRSPHGLAVEVFNRATERMLAERTA